MAEDFTPIPVDSEDTDDNFKPVLATNSVETFVPKPVSTATPTSDPEAAKEEARESEKSFMTDVGQGAGAGLVDVVQGIAELGALGIDVVFDSDLSGVTTDAFTQFKNDLRLTPTGVVGRSVENIVNFGAVFIPVMGWLGGAAKVAQGGKLIGLGRGARSARAAGNHPVGQALLKTRGRLVATTAAAAGVSDFLVSPDGMMTLADMFGVLPDVLKTEDREDETGRAEGFRRLRNKLRMGIEGTTASMLFDAALPVIKGIGTLPAHIPGVPKAAEFIHTLAFEKLGGFLMKSDWLRKNFTTAGLLSKQLYESMRTTVGRVDRWNADAANAFIAFDKAAKKAVKAQKLPGRGDQGIKQAHEDLYHYLIGTGSLDQKKSLLRTKYGNEVADAADAMRGEVDRLSRMLADQLDTAPGLSPKLRTELAETVRANQGQYLRRLYEMHINPSKYWSKDLTTSKEYGEAVSEVADILFAQGKAVDKLEARLKAESLVGEILDNNFVRNGVDLDTGLKMQAKALKKARARKGSENNIYRMTERMLMPRSEVLSRAPKLRALMGEIKDPRELFLKTIGDLSETIASNDLYKYMAKEGVSFEEAVAKANRAGGKGAAARSMVISGNDLTPPQMMTLESMGYTRLTNADGSVVRHGFNKIKDAQGKIFGGLYGDMTGNYVPNEMLSALVHSSPKQNAWNEAWAISLQAKGFSQVTKTIMSPIAQMRNFLSGALMVAGNGNITRGMDLSDSLRLTLASIKNMKDENFLQLFDLVHRTGLVDQNLILNEYQALLKEGGDLVLANSVAEAGRKIAQAAVMKPFQKGFQALKLMYAGSDNLWKTVGYFAEKGKYVDAFRKAGVLPKDIGDFAEEMVSAGLASRSSGIDTGVEFIDLFATDIVKATMPTYSRVPEAIKALRRIPVMGNFIAFPAEVMRNAANIFERGLKELSYKPSANLIKKMGQKEADIFARQVRAIGAQRLTGYIVSAYGIGKGAQLAAQTALGFGEEQMDALNLLSADYLDGHTLIPVAWDGKNVEFLDFSYLNPFDFVIAPAKAAIQAYKETGVVSDSLVKQLASAPMAALQQLLEPFASEALLSERIMDVTMRKGRSQTGAKIYAEGESAGEIVKKSFIHVMAGFSPALLDPLVQERSGRITPGRITRAQLGIPGPQGQRYTKAEELISAVTGLREMEIDLGQAMYYRGAEYSNKERNVVNSFSAEAGRNDSTVESILNAYERTNANLHRLQSKLYAEIQASRALGISDALIRRQLRKDASMGTLETNAIMRGIFAPLKVSNDLAKRIRRESVEKGQFRVLDRLPREELMRIYQNLINTPLAGIPPPVRDPGPFAAPDTSSIEPAFTPIPVEDIAGAIAAPTFTPIPVADPAGLSTKSIPTELLGANPIDAAKNQQISDRR